MKGRKPVACPEHRDAAHRKIDRRKKRANYASGGPARRPQCCVDNGRQCAQHRQWKDFKKTWIRQVRKPADDPVTQVLMDLFYSDAGDGDNGPLYHRARKGFHITRS